jgi:S1-C subfamily serine protease
VSEQLIREGQVKWAWLGVLLADLTPEVAAEFGLPIREGVIIRHVVEGSPAFDAGIVPGDIVMSMGGQETPAVVDLLRLLRTEFRVGEEVEAEIFSNGSRRTVQMLMGERPAR